MSPTTAGLGISLAGVDARFATAAGPIDALAGLDLEVAAGSFTVVIGPNGCGKSTLLRVVAGLKTPDAGAVEVGGAQPVAGDGRVGLCFPAAAPRAVAIGARQRRAADGAGRRPAGRASGSGQRRARAGRPHDGGAS